MHFGAGFLFIFLVILVINLIGAYFMSKAAAEKGYTDIGAMAICFFLGIFGYLYIVALPDKRLRQAVEEQSRLMAGLSAGSKGQNFTAAGSNDELPDL